MLKCYYIGWIHDYNRKKPIGMMNALSKAGYSISLTHINDRIIDQSQYDLLFGELKTIDLDFSNFKNVFIWSLVDLNKAIDVANKYPDTKFIIGSKSFVHDEVAIEEHKKLYGSVYMKDYPPEKINLDDYLKIITSSEKINSGLYKILNNLYYYYVPCCLSEDTIEKKEKYYDVCYFGTTENRLNLKKFFTEECNNLKLISSFNTSGIMDPNNVIDIYRKTKIIVHEYVNPPILEHPVRLGECVRQGCQYIGLSTIKLPDPDNILVPNHVLKYSYDDFKNEIYKQLNSFIPVYHELNTYDTVVCNVLNIFNKGCN